MAGPETSTASRQAGASGELGGTGGASGLDLGAMARMASMRQAMFGVTAPPVRIARFVLLEALGAGGMGIVYAAHDPHLDRRIALKVVKPDAARGRRDEARLVREAQAMARLSHPNVVQIHEVGVWEERVYIAMELVPGRTLAAWLASGGHDWRAIVGAFIEAGRGLAAAHSVGIVHRDFKPENVLCGDDGRVRVTDFGLARGELETDRSAAEPDPADAVAGLAAASLTASGAVAGTPAYMAPELFLGQGATAASDQFSFCVALYHALHGLRPFAGGDRAALMAAVLAARRQEPERMRIPGRVHRALVRGLSTQSTERFPTMTALLAAIEPRRAGSVTGTAAASVLGALGLGAAGIAVYGGYGDSAPAPVVGSMEDLQACPRSDTYFMAGNRMSTYRVPRGCKTIHVRAWGGGGGGAMYPGGGGGYAEATLRVRPEQELTVAVGGGGGSWAKGLYPAETGGAIGGHGGYSGASSGGFSGVREEGWLLVAGGGGGAGASGPGGGGGGPRGQDGQPLTTGAGAGGTPDGPGAGGHSMHGAMAGKDGLGMRGGIGGAFAGTVVGEASIGMGGGAGGGGYMAGGGGGGDAYGAQRGGHSAGGGGGSGYVDSSRAVAGTIRLETAEIEVSPAAERSWGAGIGGAGRVPDGAWTGVEREARNGRPGLVLIRTGDLSSR